MINEIVMAGELKKTYDMTENVVLAILECNEEQFYIYWLNNEFNFDDLENKYIVVKGNLSNIKVKKYGVNSIAKITAIGVKGIEMYDF